MQQWPGRLRPGRLNCHKSRRSNGRRPLFSLTKNLSIAFAFNISLFQFKRGKINGISSPHYVQRTLLISLSISISLPLHIYLSFSIYLSISIFLFLSDSLSFFLSNCLFSICAYICSHSSSKLVVTYVQGSLLFSLSFSMTHFLSFSLSFLHLCPHMQPWQQQVSGHLCTGITSFFSFSLTHFLSF